MVIVFHMDLAAMASPCIADKENNGHVSVVHGYRSTSSVNDSLSSKQTDRERRRRVGGCASPGGHGSQTFIFQNADFQNELHS